MENLHNYIVAGHKFGICLPEGMSAQHLLKPYEPFAVDDDQQTLFSLRLALVDSLRTVASEKVLKRVLKDKPSAEVEELIRLALKQL
jgi:hypothetical protein